MFLAMGFTGKEAAAWKEKFIALFNQMEAQLRNTQPALPINQKFIFEVDSDGKVKCESLKDFYQGLPFMIRSAVCPFEDGLLIQLAHACIEGLEYRACSRLEKIHRLNRHSPRLPS